MISTAVAALARIRRISEALAALGEIDDQTLTLSQQSELLIAQGASPFQEATRSGGAVKVGTITPVAGVVAVPTTAAIFSLYNNEPDGGKSMIIDWIAALNAVSTAVASQAQILCLLGSVREAVPVDGGLVLTKMNGFGKSNLPNIITLLAATALPANTGLAANWFPWGGPMIKPGAAATPGYGGQFPVDGRMIVPPGRYFAMHVLSSVVGETFNGYVGFTMKQLNLA